MKSATQYARRLRRLIAAAKSSPRSERPTNGEAITDLAVRASLMQFASDQAAAGAHRRMRAATVDLNDLRVTPIAELVECLGASFPQAQLAAEAVSRTLNAIFNRVHHLNLDFLINMAKKEARAYLEALDGLTPYSSAYVAQQALGHHAIPVDERILQFLRDEQLVDASAGLVEVQAFLERTVPAGKAEAVFNLLKQRAGSRPARKPAPAPRAAPPPPPAVVAAKPDSPVADRRPATGKTAPATIRPASAKRVAPAATDAKPKKSAGRGERPAEPQSSRSRPARQPSSKPSPSKSRRAASKGSGRGSGAKSRPSAAKRR